MRALSITRPWAELILRGKNVENRTWDTKYRGPVLLHAAQSWEPSAITFALFAARQSNIDVTDMPRTRNEHPTGIVGIARLAGVCSTEVDTPDQPCSCGSWAMPDQYHWRLRDVRRLPRPVSCRGALGLWTPPVEPVDVLAAVEAQYPEMAVAW